MSRTFEFAAQVQKGEKKLEEIPLGLRSKVARLSRTMRPGELADYGGPRASSSSKHSGVGTPLRRARSA